MPTVQENSSSNGSRQGPVFVVGMWRSGTSLFYALVNQHPQVSLLYEGDLPLLWPLFLGRKAKADWPERWEFWNSGASRHRLDINHLSRDVRTVREACEAVWDEYSAGAIRGCKSPNYYDMLPRLAKQFPGARFLVIWRNPMDVCRSVVRASTGDSFFAKRGMVLRALRGCHEMKLGYDWLVANGIPVHTVQYETLVKDPVGVMHGVASFLNIPFEPRMASLTDADRSAIYEGGHHEKVKTERIAAAKPKAEVLPARVRAKIERYIAFWQARYLGQWPAKPDPSGAKPDLWFALEHFVDGAAYRALRIFDWAVVFLYCLAPLWILRKYRAMRGRTGKTVSSKPDVLAPETVVKESLVPAYERMKPAQSQPAILERAHPVAESRGSTVSR